MSGAWPQELDAWIETVIGERPVTAMPLGGGCVASVRRLTFSSADDAVLKFGDGDFECEAMMMGVLAEAGLPVPSVLGSRTDGLLVEYVKGGGSLDAVVEAHAGELLADLHAHTSNTPGFERDTLIGPLRLPNSSGASPETLIEADWPRFFFVNRIVPFADEAVRRGTIGSGLLNRIEALGDRIHEILPEPDRLSLMHGDVWAGNVIASPDVGESKNQIAAFIDPAICFGDAEVELAFVDLFGTFGEPFYRSYRDRTGRGVWEGPDADRRRLAYQLYPLLVHTVLFGGSYAVRVEQHLTQIGF